MLGYTHPLFVLPFDHKTGLYKMLYGTMDEPTPEQKEEIKRLKRIIFQGFERAVELGVPKIHAGILADETYSKEILKEAKAKGYIAAVNTEKSGQKELEFEFGEQWKEHIDTLDLPIVKVLVRYNPGEEAEMNKRQLQKLEQLSSYARHAGRKFMIEPLIPPTDEQLTSVGGDKHRYDTELRPGLTVEMIRSMQNAGVEADIWKIEGLNKREEYEAVVTQACLPVESRGEVGVIVLGRGESKEKVFEWIDAAKGISSNIIGFAVGRTAWKDAVLAYRGGKKTEAEAATEIGQNFFDLYKFFIS
ncbi:MAG TPA: DUF2090 domain-containing protein [Patescibacteria group bacterium]|nr:DUF2090 domain-containing protein [Patescibacteria group bacterium]